MSELDPIRAPKGRRWLSALICGVAFILGMMMSAEWWMAGPAWRGLVAAGISAAIGATLAAWITPRLTHGRR